MEGRVTKWANENSTKTSKELAMADDFVIESIHGTTVSNLKTAICSQNILGQKVMDHCKQWTVKCLRWGRFSWIVYHILQQPLPDNTEQISIIKTWPKLFQRLFNVIRVNFQKMQIVTKEMSSTSKPQTWNTVVSRPLHPNETEPPGRYDAVPLHGYTEKWQYTQTKQEDQQLYFIILTL